MDLLEHKEGIYSELELIEKGKKLIKLGALQVIWGASGLLDKARLEAGELTGHLLQLGKL